MLHLDTSSAFPAFQKQLRVWTGASQGQPQAASAANASAPDLAGVRDTALQALAREIPGMSVSEFSNLDASDYTPDKIAERISRFVANGLQSARHRGKSEEDIQALYDSAVKGAEQGFKEAKDILEKLNLLGGSLGEQVQATEEATFAALKSIAPSNASQDLAETATLGVAAAQRYQYAENFELNLKTKDGDTVKIRFSHDFAAQESAAAVMDDSGNQAALMSISQYESSNYQFTVEGNLSVAEIDAIQILVKGVGQVANDFFRGDVEKAFSQVSEIAFDDSQLASMHLHMSRTEQYSAVQQYRQTEQLENPEQTQSSRRLGHLMRAMNESVQNPALDFLDQAREAASLLLRGLIEQDARLTDASSERQASYQDNLARFLSAFENSFTATTSAAT